MDEYVCGTVQGLMKYKKKTSAAADWPLMVNVIELAVH